MKSSVKPLNQYELNCSQNLVEKRQILLINLGNFRSLLDLLVVIIITRDRLSKITCIELHY